MADIDLEAALCTLGYESFRPGQREAIEVLLSVGRLLLVAPTGEGKSLTYQLPASVLPGTTLVVSPLIALMNDQVHALTARGVAATYLASTVEPRESARRLAAAARGEYKLVYVAPERLGQASFRGLLESLQCPLLVVDEAHCISEWGHDFRPEYLAIGDLLRRLGSVRVLACTATATPVVRDEILVQLGLGSETPQLVRGFARPNLHLRAQEIFAKRERADAVDALLREALGAPDARNGAALIYAPTRKESEREAARLAHLGWRAAFYHAGCSNTDRDDVQAAFLGRELDVVVATNAFGMGIDRSDVRAVVHLAPPGSVEAYYQEVGRAGRDGAPAFGLMLLSADDPPRRRHLLERGSDFEDVAPEVVEHKWGLYLELLRWAQGGSCRHDAILRYFGDEREALGGCGHCDVCERLEESEEIEDGARTEIVRKALSAVARVSGRFGMRAAVNLLRGTRDPRLERSGLDKKSTFGILSERPDTWLMRLLGRCVTAGWVGFQGDERPVVVLTEAGREVMHARRPARILLPPAEVEKPARRRGESSGRGRGESNGVADGPVFDALRAWRQSVARRDGVPAFVIAHDRTLREIAEIHPGSAQDLESVWGLGPAKRERYGAEILEAVRGASSTSAPAP